MCVDGSFAHCFGYVAYGSLVMVFIIFVIRLLKINFLFELTEKFKVSNCFDFVYQRIYLTMLSL